MEKEASTMALRCLCSVLLVLLVSVLVGLRSILSSALLSNTVVLPDGQEWISLTIQAFVAFWVEPWDWSAVPSLL